MPLHVGHKNELKHTWLTTGERKFIAKKLVCKTPHHDILEMVRSTITKQELQRLHLITKKDIANIERDFNLTSEAQKHPLAQVLHAGATRTPHTEQLRYPQSEAKPNIRHEAFAASSLEAGIDSARLLVAANASCHLPQELCLVRYEADSAGIHLTHKSERGTFEHCSKTDKHTARLTLCDANAS
ncbi:hypothetical protein J6590_077027 [Homalodisca vitripennis]|nr:hypothetical protein J6590_077027 [Homalodisca vitripennis]